jgi:plasmid maintenance system antidote protein VapI
MKKYAQDDLMNDLRERCDERGQLAVAIELGLSASFINDVLKGRRALTTNLATNLGYTPMETLYTRKADRHD